MDRADGQDGERLAKRVAAQVPCSRSDAENYIAGGWVRVDDVVVEEPMARVRDSQTVRVDAKARPDPVAPVTLIWHKPAGHTLPDGPWLPDDVAARWFSEAMRFEGDRSGIRPLKAHRRKLQALAPMGELSSGLMVFTQNPGTARKMTEDARQIEHEWLADVATDSALEDPARREDVLRSLARPLFLDGWALPQARASWQSEFRLRLAIKGNETGQVAHLCERAGVQLTGLRRLRLGRVSLAGLPVGHWRYLLPYERF